MKSFMKSFMNRPTNSSKPPRNSFFLTAITSDRGGKVFLGTMLLLAICVPVFNLAVPEGSAARSEVARSAPKWNQRLSSSYPACIVNVPGV